MVINMGIKNTETQSIHAVGLISVQGGKKLTDTCCYKPKKTRFLTLHQLPPRLLWPRQPARAQPSTGEPAGPRW